jgi:hypothetical protein
MAFIGETITVDELPQSERNYELIPEGWYTANITKAELNNTKAGTGQKIDVRYDITGPTQQGRVIFASVNIRNPSQKAEEIGRQQLGEIMRAIGLAQVTDTDQLIGATLQIKIKVRQPTERDKAAGYYESKNEVAGWKSSGGGASIPVTAPKPAATSAPGGAKPPWAK